jgi:hypothetical protein
LPVTVSRRIIMQKARDQPFPLRGVGLSPLVGMWFQVHYPPLVGVLPTFRSRYWFAIGHQRVLSLAGWSPRIRTTFHVHGLTQDTPRLLTLSSTGLSPAVAGFSKTVRLGIRVLNGVLQPRGGMPPRFGLVRVRSPLLTESLLLSFPPGTEMFQFSGLAPRCYGFTAG